MGAGAPTRAFLSAMVMTAAWSANARAAELSRTKAKEGDGKIGEWVSSGGLRRTYALHVPASYDGTRPYPLLVAFHGATGSSAFAERAGLARAAEAKGFVVASPDGYGGSWALGCPCTLADRRDIDDPRFFETLVKQVSRELRIDPLRVYAAGFSDGGTFSYRLACERAKLLAGIGVVAGALATPGECRPARPVPVIALHGSQDKVISFDKGEAAAARLAFLDGCGRQPEVASLGDPVVDGTTVRRRVWPGCAKESEVVLLEVQGGGHTWPGALFAYPAWLGRQSRDVDANQEILDFFLRHAAPAP
jgi:polyhydroxybutyrate depolymerase